MSEKVYIARNYRSKFDAAGKAKMDCETILDQNGWKNIGFKQTWISNGPLGTLISALGVTWALLRLKRGSTICLQYPFSKFFLYCLWGAKLKKCRVMCIIHDVRSLKGKYGFQESEMKALRKLDACVVHNDQMKDWLAEHGVTAKMASINAFDYLHHSVDAPKRTPANMAHLRIVFAGNLGGSTTGFLYALDELDGKNYHFDLYGVGFKPEMVKNPQQTLLHYRGFFPADKIIDQIDGDFGLVWYGDSLDSCDGAMGHYIKFNNPHKLSMYLLCEMPVIIWDKAAMASFVEEQQVGLVVSSLHELEQKLSALTEDELTQMKQNTIRIKAMLQSGQFLSQALEQLQ